MLSPLVDVVWPDVAPLIERALESAAGRYSLADVHKFLLTGAMQLWVAWRDGYEAVLVTELINYPRLRAARVVILIGENRDNWLGFLNVIEDWARANGCTKIEALARPGWERVVRDWTKSHVFLERDL